MGGAAQFRLIYENLEDKGGAGDWEELKEVEAELSSPKHSFDLESKSKTRKGSKSQLRRKLGARVRHCPPPPLPACVTLARADNPFTPNGHRLYSLSAVGSSIHSFLPR
jgi:hypothetical protein